jgi:hypothetical protein
MLDSTSGTRSYYILSQLQYIIITGIIETPFQWPLRVRVSAGEGSGSETGHSPPRPGWGGVEEGFD